MAKWIPATATFGLICLMVLPAPGVLGLAIGSVCVVVIAVSALIWCLDRMSERVAGWFTGRRRTRAVKRTGSGIGRKI